MGYPPQYRNDGSGRDTFINHAGAYWLNPLPGGTYYKSRREGDDIAVAATAGAGEQHGCRGGAPAASSRVLAASIDPFASVRLSGKALLGQSRYGTTILRAPDDEDNNDGGKSRGDGSADGGKATARVTSAVHGYAGPAALMADGSAPPPHQQSGGGDVNGDGDAAFDAHATALDVLPYDVPRPERRLAQPGHHTTGLDGTAGVTFAGAPHTPWSPPRQVDDTLLRLAPTYESTCHYGLRTGRVYTDDAAPPHTRTLPDKGVTWGKSRYV